jgi:hypothetical protein
MWTFIYLVIFIVLVIIFNHCVVEMIYSKQNKSAILYFCILFLVALALSHFSFSTNSTSIFNLENYPIPYQKYMNFERIEGFDGSGDASGSGTDSVTDSGNNCATMSITDKNVFLLNDRVNKLDVNYQSLDANVKTLQTQVEDMMNKSTESAANAVGTEPYSFSSGEEPTTESGLDTENGSGSS